GTSASLLKDVITALTPATHALVRWVGPWVVLAELAVWLAVLPLMAAYWFVSQDLPEAFVAPVLATAAILAVGVLVAFGSPMGIVVLALAVVWSLAAWAA